MITKNKITHSINVARKARDIFKSIADRNDPELEAKSDAAFIMGLLHDIGYDKLESYQDPLGHPYISAEMVRNFLKYGEQAAKAIEEHGHSLCEDIFSYVLNKADLLTDSHGIPVPSMRERVESIEERYPQTEHAASARRQYENVLAAKKRMEKEKGDPS